VSTYRLVRVGGDAECFLQAAAVLVHAQREVSVALVHGRHPFLDLAGVTVALLAEAVSQLDQKLHALLGLLEERRKRVLYVCVCVCVCGVCVSRTLAVMWKSSCSFSSSCVWWMLEPVEVCVDR